jgi:hypothetical protein
MISLTSNIRFRSVADPFLNKVQEDIKISLINLLMFTKPLQKIIEKHLRTIFQKVTSSVEMNALLRTSTKN